MTIPAKPPKPDAPQPRYGPMPRTAPHRLWTRAVVVLAVLLYVWYSAGDVRESALARQRDELARRGQRVDCDRDFLAAVDAAGCRPRACGRFVADRLLAAGEADALLALARRGLALAGGAGGAAVLDLHSGALSAGRRFVNAHRLGAFMGAAEVDAYRRVKDRIRAEVAENFGVEERRLFLTHPTFFSRLTADEPVTKHDEYWHIHIDREQYESFHYTTLLYLTDFGVDFKGGRFIFVDLAKNGKNVTVEPRKGRVSMFTSGAENPHFVERVTEGVRYAITVSFTCDKTKAIDDAIIKQN